MDVDDGLRCGKEFTSSSIGAAQCDVTVYRFGEGGLDTVGGLVISRYYTGHTAVELYIHTGFFPVCPVK